MTEQHPIIPPPDLVQQWMNAPDWLGLGCHPVRSVPGETYAKRLVEAAQWGADQELEACIDWIAVYQGLEHSELLIELLRVARRPKPPSLKQQALEILQDLANGIEGTDSWAVIQSALEQLDD